MNSSIVFLFLFSLISGCFSAGFLDFQLTSDKDVLVQIGRPSDPEAETVRLFAYESRTFSLYTQGALQEISVQFQLLHHFSGEPLSETIVQKFQLNNNGVVERSVLDNEFVILSVQSLFRCENGYFGPVCERKSQRIQNPVASKNLNSEIFVESKKKQFDFQVSDDVIIYISLAFFVVILIIANCILCCFRRGNGKSHSYLDTTLDNSKIFWVEVKSLSRLEESVYLDAPSNFLPNTTLQTRV